MTGLWKISLVLPDAGMASGFEQAVHDIAQASTLFAQPDGSWQFEFYCMGMPPYDFLAVRLSLAAAAAGIGAPDFSAVPVAEADWLWINQASFKPIEVGRFRIRQDFDSDRNRAGKIRLTINAGMAFGSGDHATTYGCLLALQHIIRRRQINNIFDLGCGTGILAMAAARLTPARITASDIDPQAIQVCGENLRINRLAGRVRLIRAAGLDDPMITRRAPYDLILANILARPLIQLAGILSVRLAPGGRIVLSGLLDYQARQILAAYRPRGMVLQKRIAIDGWSTLILG